ncbi:MAG: hypothetical protein HUU04_03835 [Verrucomicrobiae bacterium]|nr:hypothetical protein [Verrucomicrobiae bacterium]
MNAPPHPRLFLLLLLSALAIALPRVGLAASTGLEWATAEPGGYPRGWDCKGAGQGRVLPSFGDEKHPVVEMESTGASLCLWNYGLASAYGPETMVRFKIQFRDLLVGCLGFAQDGGGGRGGLGMYFTKSGAFEVADERGARTKVLDEYKTGVWYEVRAWFSTTEETWDLEVTDLSTGKQSSLKGLPWSTPAIRAERAYAGLVVALWSPGTVVVSEIEIGLPSDDVRSKKQAALPILSLPLTRAAPRLDGVLEPGEWDEAAHIDHLRVLNTGALDPRPCDVYVAADATNLYLAFRQPLRGARDVQPSYTKRDDNIWMDDCFEFLFAPEHAREEKARIHFIGNAAGAFYDDKGGDKAWNGSWTYRTKVTAAAWEGELSLPLHELGPPPKKGEGWAFNAGRSLLSHDAMLTTSYSVWAMPSKAALGFLDLATYGTLLFRGRQPWVALDRAAPRDGGRFLAIFTAHNPSNQPVEFHARADDQSAVLAPLAEQAIRVPPSSSRRFELATDFPLRWRGVVRVGRSPETILRVDVSNPLANQPVFLVRPYPLRNQLEVELDLSNLRRVSGAEFHPVLRVLSLDRKKAWIEQPIGRIVEKIVTRIPIAKLPEGDYLAEARILSAKDEIIAVHEKSFIRGDPRPAWSTRHAGAEDRLLHPFSPVAVTETRSGRQVEVWGRRHDFGMGGLPRQVTVTGGEGAPSGGVPLLDGPVQILAGRDGRREALEFRNQRGLLAKPTRAAWLSRARLSDGKTVALRTLLEPDGMIRFDVTLPAGTALDTFELQAPLRSVSHYYTSFLDQYSSEAGRLPKEGFVTPFRPLIWAGDMQRGICWFTETDRDWLPADFEKGIALTPRATGATLRVQWIGQPVTFDRERVITFGLQVTPVKPLPRGHFAWRIGKDFIWPWFHHFNDALTQPMVHRPDFRAHVAAEHARGCAVLPYFFPASMKAEARDCLAYKNEWGHPGDLPDLLAEQAMPPDMKMQMDTSWTDYFMAGLETFIRDFGIDGVYYDTALPFRRSQVDEKGARSTHWPIFACREFIRRTANLFEKHRGPGNYVLLHHMSDNMAMPIFSFMTLAFDGEQYNRVPPDCVDYTRLLPLDRAEVINNPEHWGFPCMFLPEIPVRKTAEARRTTRAATDSLLALLLPLGSSWWDGPMDWRRQQQIADALERFGIATATFHPYWRQREIAAPEGVLVSYYAKGARRLVIVSNPGPSPKKAVLKLAALAVRCADALDEPMPKPANGEIALDLAPRSFRLLELEG